MLFPFDYYFFFYLPEKSLQCEMQQNFTKISNFCLSMVAALVQYQIIGLLVETDERSPLTAFTKGLKYNNKMHSYYYVIVSNNGSLT